VGPGGGGGGGGRGRAGYGRDFPALCYLSVPISGLQHKQKLRKSSRHLDRYGGQIYEAQRSSCFLNYTESQRERESERERERESFGNVNVRFPCQ